MAIWQSSVQGGPAHADAERHDVGRIMRAAERMGHDPSRVARALDHSPLEPRELQRTVEVKRRPVVRSLAKAFARRP